MTVSKVVYTNASDGRQLVIKLSGTAAEVLQALADEKVDRTHLLVLKDDATYAVYFRKV
jgi:hypothetical protein